MRVIFMGTPDFSVPVLDALVEAGHEVAAVYCQPPRPAGRGKKDRPTPVQARAEALGLPVRHPVSLRSAEEQAAFAALEADVAVVVAYGLILPQAILDAPAKGCLNIHASLLPRWRGAAPIHRAVMAGDRETGVCIMQMEAGLDTGPVLLSRATPIGPQETTGDLHDRLSRMGAELIVDALTRLDALEPETQPEDGVCYAEKVDKAEAAVDWTRPAEAVDRQIRGLSPFPGAWAVINGQRVKLLGSCMGEGDGAPGEVLEPQAEGVLTVACGAGAVRITRLQRAGRGAQDAAEFLRGMPLAAGARFEAPQGRAGGEDGQ
ncbi:MAG: methionyl-tRNA formyltransferase [Sediminimonas qiaohouensis]|uniref:Methionyl-tRNA formyltransferase n=1 Tax=Sediminimonas qiaohouensis TaxID=552061 RepID=A0A7C9LSZ6_9RHOB|nr:methionyl-tRNA formyltransferase [Sediminimonas qiaohouensis]MTJ05476.1 methionyl-tRNA formyltransferase [Sediminimonas qiaohouensis]